MEVSWPMLFREIFDALREFMTPPDPPKRQIGFVTNEDKGKKVLGARNKDRP